MQIEAAKKIVVVTGGAGFVGSHLCERLVKEGYAVISLDNYFTGSPENHVEGVAYRTGHTKNIAVLVPETPHLVFHLGEYARTEKSFEDIEHVWDLNKVGTFAVLEYCRRKKCKIVYAGSSTKFADNGEGRDQSPYAWTKATNTELVKNYATWFGLEYAITYFYNVYGPRELSGPYGTLIRIFTELHRQGLPLTITAPGTQTRNFTHVYDIVDGLLLAGEKGHGDGYGIGADQSYSVLEVAAMFGGETLLMPERLGNRLTSGVDNAQVKALGWKQNHTLTLWIEQVKADIGTVKGADKRVLIYTTTYLPQAGAAEYALFDVCQALPHVQFDIITTYSETDAPALSNVTLYRLGNGSHWDKWLLPLRGAALATTLKTTHHYAFAWSLFASYAALAALRTKGERLPFLITLADQRLANVPWYVRLLFRRILGTADQVYALDTYEAQTAMSLAQRTILVRSIGDGDAFANQIRIAYTLFLKQRLK